MDTLTWTHSDRHTHIDKLSRTHSHGHTQTDTLTLTQSDTHGLTLTHSHTSTFKEPNTLPDTLTQTQVSHTGKYFGTQTIPQRVTHSHTHRCLQTFKFMIFIRNWFRNNQPKAKNLRN